MASNCNKLIKEAFEGIEFRYKLEDVLSEAGGQKFSASQLEGFLKKKGVSPKEIRQSGLLKGMDNDNRALPASDWLSRSGEQKFTTEQTNEFDEVSLGAKGMYNDTYKATLLKGKVPETNAPSVSHFSDQMYADDITGIEQDELQHSLIGWRRTHEDKINGKPTTVLNEFQSDWAQTERAGRGTFESNADGLAPKETTTEELITYLRTNDLMDGDTARSRLADFEEENGVIKTSEDLETFADEIGEIDAYNELTNYGTGMDIVADFPMSEQKFHQYQIVATLDEAIKNGTNRIAIPIERENELMGSKGVTKFYDSLNKKILPDIRKKLEKQGLRLKVGKETYGNDDIKNLVSLASGKRDEFFNILDTMVNDLDKTNYPFNKPWEDIRTDIKSGELNALEVFFKSKKWLKTISYNNTLHTIDIVEIPDKPVRWDIYSILGAIGLADLANKLQGAQNE